MSDELADQWHRAVCNELEAQVKNRLFFLWVSVDPQQAGEGSVPTPEEVEPQEWKAVAESVEGWLESLNPDTVDADDPPKFDARPAETAVELAAIPKKERRRGSDPLILNLHPGLTYFTGSYTARPAPELPDDD